MDEKQTEAAAHGTVGGLSVGTGGVLELLRGFGTSGLIAYLLYQALDDRMQDMSSDVQAVEVQIAELRTDVVELQAEVKYMRRPSSPANAE